jgi:hypothetical protein
MLVYQRVYHVILFLQNGWASASSSGINQAEHFGHHFLFFQVTFSIIWPDQWIIHLFISGKPLHGNPQKERNTYFQVSCCSIYFGLDSYTVFFMAIKRSSPPASKTWSKVQYPKWCEYLSEKKRDSSFSKNIEPRCEYLSFRCEYLSLQKSSRSLSKEYWTKQQAFSLR